MRPYLHIIRKNTFTLFNFVNLVLALMVAFVGSYKNMLFILIAIANTFISIINEIRAQKIVNKMRLIAEQKPTILKDGKPHQVSPDEVQKGDITVLALGDQVLYDSVIQEGQVEVNEAFITGEQDNILKKPGDRLYSGSFIVSGTVKAKVEKIGSENSLNKIEQSAKTIKTADSQLFTLMNNIVKYISYALIPIGALLLWARFRVPDTSTEVAVTSTVAGLINMIPEGLILLTSSVLALATIRLSKQKVLVQDLYSIETLARVDSICLDKTGTLTTGNMTVKGIILPADISTASSKSSTTPASIITPAKDSAHAITPAEKRLLKALEAILSLVPADNATSHALHAKFAKTPKNQATSEIAKYYELIPFSSDRKYSGIKNNKEELLMGATEFVTDNEQIINQAKSITGNYRVITVVKKTTGRVAEQSNNSVLDFSTQLLGFIILEDELRQDAKEILNFFYDNDVAVNIISGDDLATVTTIATQVGFKSPKAVDISALKTKNYSKLVQDYNIFTRVKPTEKKELIKALKKQGNTVAMTGDGVNDILAMKEADCSIAIGEGSDAARRASKLVLLSSDFKAVPSIIAEGRQSINNLERSTSLFLAKTVYAGILAVLFTILPFEYPFSPIEMSLLNFACIGYPGLILALETNTKRIKNQFLKNILTYSVPIGLTVSIAMLALAVIAHITDFTHAELNTASVFVTFAIDITLIYWISRPLNKLRAGLLVSIVAIMATAFFVPFIRNFFEFTFLSPNELIIVAVILAASFGIFTAFRLLMRHLSARFLSH
ncbi:HAD-IC family P-type ATPase [Candidatus Saccharibacteria bacterium]|nr:HAD-IC family P-type ATPase [Candidatus Saccharibacteria bacterium]